MSNKDFSIDNLESGDILLSAHYNDVTVASQNNTYYSCAAYYDGNSVISMNHEGLSVTSLANRKESEHLIYSDVYRFIPKKNSLPEDRERRTELIAKRIAYYIDKKPYYDFFSDYISKTILKLDELEQYYQSDYLNITQELFTILLVAINKTRNIQEVTHLSSAEFIVRIFYEASNDGKYNIQISNAILQQIKRYAEYQGMIYSPVLVNKYSLLVKMLRQLEDVLLNFTGFQQNEFIPALITANCLSRSPDLRKIGRII